MKTLVLCGGKGVRAYPHTLEVPKPLLEVGDRPILHHVLEVYARQGFDRFVLAAGYRNDLIEEFAAGIDEAWTIEVVDTGEETNTGERVRRCQERLGDEFFVTYGDGLGDVDLHALLSFHRSHAGAATLTSVPLPSQYGTIDSDATGRVSRFREKPQLDDHRINAGFFVFDRRAFDVWSGEDLEREVLPALAGRGELFAYAHSGFWRSMDTYKDALELSALCAAGHPPWLPRFTG
ncbi:MAG: glucose-phosphate cytidylyltransferase [Acidimicrobiaceae bacterium]